MDEIMGDFSSGEPMMRSVTASDFQIISSLGEGAFGKVCLVRKIDSGNLYAMKMINKVTVVRRVGIEQAIIERQILEATASNPFIVGLNYAFQTEKRLFLILDYAPGNTMKHLMQETPKKRFEENLAQFYMAEVVLALESMHSRGILYRDLKPENILMGMEGHVLLSDFGLSKMGQNAQSVATTFCGTPEYAAPEIIQRKGYGLQIDHWALGILCYELFVGKPPWTNENMDVLFKEIMETKIKFPDFMPAEARKFVKALLEVDTTKRLGCNSIDDIKAHRFFAGIQWGKLGRKEVHPPWRPQSLRDMLVKDREQTASDDASGFKTVTDYDYDAGLESPRAYGSNENTASERDSALAELGGLFEGNAILSEVTLADSSIVFDSPQMVHLLGLDDACERIGRGFVEDVHSNDRDRLQGLIDKCRESLGKPACLHDPSTLPSRTFRIHSTKNRAEYSSDLSVASLGDVADYVFVELDVRCPQKKDAESMFVICRDVTPLVLYRELAAIAWQGIVTNRRQGRINDYFARNVTCTLNHRPMVVNNDNATGINLVLHLFAAFDKGFPDFKMAVKSEVHDCKGVVYHWKFNGKHNGPFMLPSAGITDHLPGTDRAISISGILVVKYTNYRIADMEWFFDAVDFREQLGGMTSVKAEAEVEEIPEKPPVAESEGGGSSTVQALATAFFTVMLPDPNRSLSALGMVSDKILCADSVFGSEGPLFRGETGVNKLLAAYDGAFDNLAVDVTACDVVGEEAVTLRLAMKGRHVGAIGPLKETGKEFSTTGTAICRGRGQSLTELHVCWDVMDLLRGVGVFDAPPAAAEKKTKKAASKK